MDSYKNGDLVSEKNPEIFLTVYTLFLLLSPLFIVHTPYIGGIREGGSPKWIWRRHRAHWRTYNVLSFNWDIILFPSSSDLTGINLPSPTTYHPSDNSSVRNSPQVCIIIPSENSSLETLQLGSFCLQKLYVCSLTVCSDNKLVISKTEIVF